MIPPHSGTCMRLVTRISVGHRAKVPVDGRRLRFHTESIISVAQCSVRNRGVRRARPGARLSWVRTLCSITAGGMLIHSAAGRKI